MRLSLLLVLLLNALCINAQQTFTVAELNAENFFDCRHDDGKDDKAFLPDGGKKWTKHRFYEKLRNVSKVLISMGGIAPPDVIALIEVENDSVLKKLTRNAILRKAGYQYVMTKSDDPRGMNVALLYMPETFKLISYKGVKPMGENGLPIPTRSILHVKGRAVSGDTLHMFVCHFSSKLKGRKAVRNRMSEAYCLRRMIDSLQSNCTERIIILGDFNDSPISPTLTKVLSVEPNVGNDSTAYGCKLYNLADGQAIGERNRFGGTYKYDGRWEMLDQCIVSGNLLDATSNFYTSHSNFSVWSPDFLLERDPEDLGWRPRRTYLGYRYHAGYSDHLPILVRFTMKWRW